MITTYIIIGGKSSRMGSDKASLLLNGSTFLNRIITALDQLKTTINIVSSLAIHENLAYKTLPDFEKNKGPVSAIISALNDTKTMLTLILSGDIPLIEYNLLAWLVSNHHKKYDATIVCCEQKKMPLIGVYNKQCLNIFKKHLHNNQLKLMNVLEDLNVNYIEIPKKWAKQTTNINTPEQLKAIQA